MISETTSTHTDNTNETAASDSMEIRLRPTDIAINPKFSELRTSRGTKEYSAGIKRLAKQFEEEGGQKQPVTVRFNTVAEGKDKDLSYELVAGHRRYDAAVLAGVDLLCKFEDLSDTEAMRWARRENFTREDFSPMEKARIIVGMRIDKMTTKQIADELGVSDATVTQTEKLINMPQEVQTALEDGRLTPSGALELAPVEGKARPKVLAGAQKEAVKEVEKEAAVKAKKAEVSGLARDKKVAEEAQAKATAAKAGKVKVEGKHVRRAAKKVKGAIKKHKAAQRSEIVEVLVGVGKRTDCTPIAGLCQVVLAWIGGKASDKDVKGAFGDLANCISNGKRVLPTAERLAKKVAEKKAPLAKVKAKVKAKAKAKGKAKAKKSSPKPTAATHRALKRAKRMVKKSSAGRAAGRKAATSATKK